MAELFYPELFKDLDPVEIHPEYLDIFHKGLGWDVRRNGTFVYPQLQINPMLVINVDSLKKKSGLVYSHEG